MNLFYSASKTYNKQEIKSNLKEIKKRIKESGASQQVIEEVLKYHEENVVDIK